ncbi:MAG: hypothetical protein ACRD3W_13125 [Terriglobales bacterium]
MMFELKMPVTIYRGNDWIGSGELLPNGAELALCVDGRDGEGFELFNYSVDTRIVEEKIPLTFFSEGEQVADGELFQSGTNICLCPLSDHTLDLLDPSGFAELHLQPDGWAARLEITRGH